MMNASPQQQQQQYVNHPQQAMAQQQQQQQQQIMQQAPPNYQLVETLEGHTQGVSCCKFSPDGNWCATACMCLRSDDSSTYCFHSFSNVHIHIFC